MLYYVLNKNIEGEKILKDIERMVNNFSINNQTEQIPILCISLKSISYDDHTMIPKLEHKKTPA
jgi:hypothetical protein